MTSFGIKFFANATEAEDLELTPSLERRSPKPTTSVPVTKRKERNRCEGMPRGDEARDCRDERTGDRGAPPEARREAGTRFSFGRNRGCLTSVFWTSGLQKYKRINFHCFKPPTL